MPVNFDPSNINGYSTYDDDGSGTGCVGPDTPPESIPESPLDNPNLRSYWWERFNDIANPQPMIPTGPMSDDEIAAQWAFYGGNPLDLPLQNLSFQFRSSYEAQQMYEQYRVEREQANFIAGEVARLNGLAQEISDSQARANFISEMQKYINSHLNDSAAFNAGMAIYSSNVTSGSTTTTSQTGSGWAQISGTGANDLQVTGSVTVTDTSGNVISTSTGDITRSVDLGSLMMQANLRAMTVPASLGSPDIQIGTIDLSKKPENMSYSEYVFRVALKRALEARGKNLSPVDFENIIAAYKAGGFLMYNNGIKVDEAFLLAMVANSKFNLQNVFFDEDVLNNVLESAGYDSQTLQRTLGTVNVTSPSPNVTTSEGQITGSVSLRPLIMSSVGGAAMATTATLPAGTQLSVEAATLLETAKGLAKAGVMSPALLGIVEAAAIGPGAAGLMLGAGYYFLFDYMITRAQQIAVDEAQKTALANEIATLWNEVARKDVLAQQAKITLINIAANQPKTGWSIPSDWDLPKGAIVPVTPTGMQPINPNDPNKSNTPDLTPIIIGLITATLGVAVDKLTASQKEQLQADGHTLPSNAPDPSREPTGKPAPETDDGKIRENITVKILARAGYEAEQTPVLTEQDYIDNPWIDRNKERDIRLEGKIFDVYSPSTANKVTLRDGIAEKVVLNQTRRIVLNMDYTSVTLEELKEVLIDNPIKDLEEIIVIKGDQIILFYPFK